MAEQTIQLHSADEELGVSHLQWHPGLKARRYRIISDLGFTTTNRYFRRIRFNSVGGVELYFSSSAESGADLSPRDLSSLFETDGSFTVEAGGFSVTVHMNGSDTVEPYLFTPSNAQDVLKFMKDLRDDGNAPYNGTLTLRDFEPVTLEVRGSLVGPAPRINGHLVLEDNTLEITGSLVGPAPRISGRISLGIQGGFEVTFPNSGFADSFNYGIWDNSVVQPGPADWFKDASLSEAHRNVEQLIITTNGHINLNFGTGDIQALKLSLLPRIDIELTLTDGSTLTLHGIHDDDEADPYFWLPPNTSATSAFRVKAIALADHTLVARFTLREDQPLEVRGFLVGPASQINGRLSLGEDTPLEITGSLVGSAPQISGRLSLGEDALLEITGSLVGPAPQISGRITLGLDTPLEVRGSLVGPAPQISGRVSLRIAASSFGTNDLVLPPSVQVDSYIVLALLRATVNLPDITVDPVTPIQGTLEVSDTLTIDGVERHSPPFPPIRLRREGLNFFTYFDNEGSPQYPNAKLFIQTTLDGPAISFSIDATGGGFNNWKLDDESQRTELFAIITDDFFLLAIGEVDPLEVRGSLIGPASHIGGRIILVDDDPLEVLGSLVGPASQINGRVVLIDDTPLEITGSLVGPASQISGRIILVDDDPLEVRGSLVGPGPKISGRIILVDDDPLEVRGSLVGSASHISGQIILKDASLPFGISDIILPTSVQVDTYIVLALLKATVSLPDITVDPVTPIQGELKVSDTLTINGVERYSSSFPPIRLRKEGSSDFSTYFDNEGSPQYPNAKLFIQTTLDGPAISFSVDNTGGGFNNWGLDDESLRPELFAITTNDFFLLAIGEVDPLEVRGSLVGPASQISGRLSLGEDASLEVRGSLVGPGSQISGRLSLGEDALLEITGFLVGPEPQISGRIILVEDTPLEITGSLVGSAPRIDGRLTLGSSSVVILGMAEQTIQLHSADEELGVSHLQWHPGLKARRYRIISDLGFTTTNRYFRRIRFNSVGGVELYFSSSAESGADLSPRDLSSLFETDGSFTVEAGGFSVTVHMNGSDTVEPYLFTPSNSQDVLKFMKDLRDDGNAPYNGTLTLRDFEPVTGAEVPSVVIDNVPSGNENTNVRLSSSVSGGMYDEIDYAWGVEGGTLDDPTLETPTWTRPEVGVSTDYGINLTVTARGTGTLAKDGTSEDATASMVSATVRNFSSTPTDVDYIWMLDDRDATLSSLSGGTNSEAHTPSGWTREEPDPTETEAVWRSRRTRRFTSGTFSSADPWGSPDRYKDRLLILSDLILPTGRRLVGGLRGSLILSKDSSIIFDPQTPIVDGDNPPILGAINLVVFSLRIINSKNLRLIEEGIDDVEYLFSEKGEHQNRRIHIQIDVDGDYFVSLSFDQIDPGGSNNLRILYDTSPDQVLDLDNISNGIRYIFFVTDPTSPPPDVVSDSVLRYSDLGLITDRKDDPPNLNILARMERGYNFSSSVPGPTRDAKRSNNSFGSISLINSDGELDGIVDRSWEGSELMIKVGGSYNVGLKGESKIPFWDFFEVVKASVSSIKWDQDRIIIEISDKGDKLVSKNIQPVLYEGGGPLEGGDGLKGKPIPLCFGEVQNISPVLIDEVNLIYQIHDGSIEHVYDVRDSGVSLSFNRDVLDILSEDVSLGDGEYNTDLSKGYIRLNSPPEGGVTTDVKGYNLGGYVYSAGNIMILIATKYLGLDLDRDIHVDSIQNADEDRSMGFYTGISPVQVSTIFNQLVKGINSFWCFSKVGQLCAEKYYAPENENSEKNITSSGVSDAGLQREVALPPVWRCIVRHSKSWSIQSDKNLAASIRESKIDENLRKISLYGEEYRQVISEDYSILKKYPNAREITVDTLLTGLNSESNAQIEADDRLARDKVDRGTYRIILVDTILEYELGNVVSMSFPRYGLDSGKNFLVIGFKEDSSSNTTEVTLYG